MKKPELIATLKARFEANPKRHKKIAWGDVEKRLLANDVGLATLAKMEDTGGEPDVVGTDSASGEFIFVDCSAESPAGRRSLCFDRAAWESRKANKPASDSKTVATEIGITILNEREYRDLQKLGEFDLKTSSWIETPDGVRKSGGAMFCDRRYGTVWTYHNGAESYYAARGFRGSVRI